MYKDFVSFMENSFPLSKLKDDLFFYLSLEKQTVATVVSYGVDEKEITITAQDNIEILVYRITKKYLMHAFFPYIVEVIIGDYVNKEELGIVRLSKCKAEMMYNSEFKLVSVDFNHDELG